MAIRETRPVRLLPGARKLFDQISTPLPPSDGGSAPPISRSQATALGGATQWFDTKLREAVWLLVEEFPNSSSLTQGFEKRT